jgi:hypothetical protein
VTALALDPTSAGVAAFAKIVTDRGQPETRNKKNVEGQSQYFTCFGNT